MSKKPLIAVFCLSTIGLTFGLVVSLNAASNICADLRKSEEVHVIEARERIERTRLALLEFSNRLGVIYAELKTLEGNIPIDIEPTIGRLVTLADEIEAKANEYFEYADADDQLFQQWSEPHEKCFGQNKLEVLAEWQAADYEFLSTTAGFLSGFGGLISKWPKVWRQFVSEKTKFPEGNFDGVGLKAEELAESENLLLESAQIVEELLIAALP